MKKLPKGYTLYKAEDYLKTEEDCARYLEAVLDESGNDPLYITKALGNIARARGMSKVAKEAGISRDALYKAFSDGGNPTISTVLKVMDVLGLRMRVVQ